MQWDSIAGIPTAVLDPMLHMQTAHNVRTIEKSYFG